jgi:hypothetical protein
MKKMIFTGLLLVTCSWMAHAQTEWKKIMLGNDVSILFPGAPAESGNNGQKSFVYMHPDSTANMIALVSDLKVLAGIDEATLAAEMEKEEFWEQAKTGFMGSVGAGGTLVKDEVISIGDRQALRMELDRKNNSGGVNKLTVLIFVKGTNSYNLIFNSRGGKADPSWQSKYFDSLSLKN